LRPPTHSRAVCCFTLWHRRQAAIPAIREASSGLRRVIRSGKYLPIGSATAPKRDRPLKQYLLPTELTPSISNFLKLKSSQFSCKKDQATRAVTGVTFSQTGRFIWRLCHSEAPPGPTNNRNAISKARCNRLFPASRWKLRVSVPLEGGTVWSGRSRFGAVADPIGKYFPL